MAENNKNITFKGDPIEVSGNSLKKGEIAPDFSLVATDMSDLTLNSLPGKVVIVSVVPSLDTPVCSIQTQRFNQEIDNLGSEEVAVLTVSRDLPMAQKRWCGAEGVERVVCASDYKYRTFGDAFGVELLSLGLLARAIFVIDKEGRIQHVEYVSEVTDEPDYEAALDAAKALL